MNDVRFAFFGHYSTFGLDRLGGIESIVRRLGSGLLNDGISVDCVLFGAAQDDSSSTVGGIGLHLTRSFASALELLARRYSAVVVFYLPPPLRPAFAAFRHITRRRLSTYHYYTVFDESALKRQLMFADARFLRGYRGLFSVSPRLERQAARTGLTSNWLLPPVPGDFFRTLDEKGTHAKPRISFIGRTDPRKGAGIAFELFRRLSREGRFETTIYGYPWPHHAPSLRLHSELCGQSTVRYVQSTFDAYSKEVDEQLIRAYRQTDILILPYSKLSSTIDVPLVLLEGMAGLCCVVTADLGDLKRIYGSNRSIVRDATDVTTLYRAVERVADDLVEERARVARRVQECRFDSATVSTRLRIALENVDIEHGRAE